MNTSLKSIGAEGILDESELVQLGKAERRVYELMKDMKWHDANEIRMAAGTGGKPASEGLRRLRALKEPLGEIRYYIERKRDPECSRLFLYRVKHAGSEDLLARKLFERVAKFQPELFE